MSNIADLRYIVFLLDSKIKQHDGKIFCSLPEARRYAIEAIEENYCDKAVVGMFVMQSQAKEMTITMVETIGFAKDKKDVSQLVLFSRF